MKETKETKLKSYKGTTYEGYGPSEWAIVYIGSYGLVDDVQQKQWVMDQIIRILKGTPVEVYVTERPESDGGGKRYRYKTGKPSLDYLDYVETMGRKDWDEGIAPKRHY